MFSVYELSAFYPERVCSPLQMLRGGDYPLHGGDLKRSKFQQPRPGVTQPTLPVCPPHCACSVCPWNAITYYHADFSRWGILAIDLINKQPARSIKMLFCISITVH